MTPRAQYHHTAVKELVRRLPATTQSLEGTIHTALSCATGGHNQVALLRSAAEVLHIQSLILANAAAALDEESPFRQPTETPIRVTVR